LVFDDLGALFWKLLEKYPAIAKAYADRYPVVIADEHQDASELQDAFVRRFGARKLVVFADPMQLIYGFRGSDEARLQRHISQVGGTPRELRTPHRWNGESLEGKWLLAVRARLGGASMPASRPPTVQVSPGRYVNEMKSIARLRALNLKNQGNSVAIIVRENDELGDLRGYLSRNNVFVRQLGGRDFEESHEEMEQLPLLSDWTALAHFAIERLSLLVPTIEDVAASAKSRIKAGGISLDKRCSEEAKAILASLEPMRAEGPAYYFRAMVAALESLRKLGHNLPRLQAVRALRATAESLSGQQVELDEALRAYSQCVVTQAQQSFQIDRGIYLLTAHQSKGKEFDAVIIFNASKRWYPDDDENRRVFYVALTRATKSWTVIHPETDASPLLRHM